MHIAQDMDTTPTTCKLPPLTLVKFRAMQLHKPATQQILPQQQPSHRCLKSKWISLQWQPNTHNIILNSSESLLTQWACKRCSSLLQLCPWASSNTTRSSNPILMRPLLWPRARASPRPKVRQTIPCLTKEVLIWSIWTPASISTPPKPLATTNLLRRPPTRPLPQLKPRPQLTPPMPRPRPPGRRRLGQSFADFGWTDRLVRTAKKSKAVASLMARKNFRRRRDWAGNIWRRFARTF